MILSKFLRQPSSGKYIREIDALRFFAILPVVIMHMNTSYFRNFENEYIRGLESSIIKYGVWGVELFFVISGFVISLPFFIKIKSKNYKILTKEFFIKRIRRIEPPFVISLLIIYLLSLTINRFSFIDSIDNLIATLFYVHKIIYAEWSIINPITWSLETEIQFYIIIPIIFSALSKVKKSHIYLLTSFIFIFSIFLNSSDLLGPNLNKSLLVYGHLFILGIMLSYIYVYSNYLLIKSKIFDLIFPISFFLIYEAKILEYPILLDIGIFVLFISVFKSNIFNKIFCRNIFVIIGGMCYSIYLLHYAVLESAHKFLKYIQVQNYLIVNILSIVAVALISSLFFLYIEKPFMNPIKNLRIPSAFKIKNDQPRF